MHLDAFGCIWTLLKKSERNHAKSVFRTFGGVFEELRQNGHRVWHMDEFLPDLIAVRPVPKNPLVPYKVFRDVSQVF